MLFFSPLTSIKEVREEMGLAIQEDEEEEPQPPFIKEARVPMNTLWNTLCTVDFLDILS